MRIIFYFLFLSSFSFADLVLISPNPPVPETLLYTSQCAGGVDADLYFSNFVSNPSKTYEYVTPNDDFCIQNFGLTQGDYEFSHGETYNTQTLSGCTSVGCGGTAIQMTCSYDHLVYKKCTYTCALIPPSGYSPSGQVCDANNSVTDEWCSCPDETGQRAQYLPADQNSSSSSSSTTSSAASSDGSGGAGCTPLSVSADEMRLSMVQENCHLAYLIDTGNGRIRTYNNPRWDDCGQNCVVNFQECSEGQTTIANICSAPTDPDPAYCFKPEDLECATTQLTTGDLTSCQKNCHCVDSNGFSFPVPGYPVQVACGGTSNSSVASSSSSFSSVASSSVASSAVSSVSFSSSFSSIDNSVVDYNHTTPISEGNYTGYTPEQNISLDTTQLDSKLHDINQSLRHSNELQTQIAEELTNWRAESNSKLDLVNGKLDGVNSKLDGVNGNLAAINSNIVDGTSKIIDSIEKNSFRKGLDDYFTTHNVSDLDKNTKNLGFQDGEKSDIENELTGSLGQFYDTSFLTFPIAGAIPSQHMDLRGNTFDFFPPEIMSQLPMDLIRGVLMMIAAIAGLRDTLRGA